MTSEPHDEGLGIPPAEDATESGVDARTRVARLVEQALNQRPPRSQADKSVPKNQAAKAAKAQIAELLKESKALDGQIADKGLVAIAVSAYFRGGRPSAADQAAIRRIAEIQTEAARIRLDALVGWAVLDVDLEAMTAKAAAREAVASFPFAHYEYSFSLGQTSRSFAWWRNQAVEWPTSTARYWLGGQFRAALPERVTSHLALATVHSPTLSGTVTSQDAIYLPAAADIGRRGLPAADPAAGPDAGDAHLKTWGVLDGRKNTFWLRETGRGVVRYADAAGPSESYHSAFYTDAIQPIINLDLTTFRRLRGRSPRTA
ncbi:MAG: hypothetical protein LBG60_05735 [Bifidobacteriaceae bacterium]|jgi:hypothetical protein|nr:hypothetical protein [Bifidobacteriaceae bacterium]